MSGVSRAVGDVLCGWIAGSARGGGGELGFVAAHSQSL